MRFIVLTAALVAIIACSGSSDRQPARSPTPAPAAGSEHLRPPFTADELRAGLPVGTELVLRVEQADKPTLLQRWDFVAADESGCTIHSRILTEDGSLQTDAGKGTSTWAELEAHAHFPADRSTRADSTVTVTGGTFETWLFVVQPDKPGGPVKKFHFAKTMPGPPVLMEVIRGDETLMKMELVSRKEP